MSSFDINEMQEMQKALQDKYKDKWEPICPEIGQNKLLWMIGEIGEIIDIVKKNGGLKSSTDEELRKDIRGYAESRMTSQVAAQGRRALCPKF